MQVKECKKGTKIGGDSARTYSAVKSKLREKCK
jgi:hypothetical protein